MKHGQKRRNLRHPGVTLMQLASGDWVGRWFDPVGVTPKLKQQNLTKAGLTNATKRRRWAVKKSGELAKLRAAVALGTVAPTRTTVAAAVKDYLEAVTHEATKAAKRVPLEAFSTWCGEQGVASLTDLAGPKLMRWRDSVLAPKRGHLPSTQNKWLVATGIFLRWCLERGTTALLNSDAIRAACKRAAEPQRAIEFLRPPQLRQLLAAAIKFDETGRKDWRIAPVILTLLLTGCRFAEVANLRWDEIALEDGEIRLDAGRTKTRRARVITCKESPTLLALLRALHERRGDAERVFPGLRHPTWEAAHLRLISDGAPEFSAHGLRRTCGTLLTNAPSIYHGASAWHSARRLGHSVEQSERDYAGHLPGLSKDATTIEAVAGIEAECSAIVEAEKVKAT